MIVDNLPVLEQKRYQLIIQIQKLLKEGCSYRETARRLGIGRNTIAKYRKGNPLDLCKKSIKVSKIDPYHDEILQQLKDGCSKSATVKDLYKRGYAGSMSTAFDYLVKLERITGMQFSPQPYIRTYTEALKYKTGSIGRDYSYITRAGIFGFLWMNGELTEMYKKYLFKKYPILYKIKKCIQDFRYIFSERNMPSLYLFIEEYSKCDISEIRSFAKGLQRDLDAVENAVASNLSNGFVEGTNSRLKMVKRTMYGRCNRALLTAKMMLGRNR
jgi:transcriptional regulator with XRE-family HTH domain